MQLFRLAASSFLTVAHLQGYAVATVFPGVPAADIAQHFSEYYGVRQHAQQRVQATTATLGGVTQHRDFHLLTEQHPVKSTRRWYAMSVFLPADWITSSVAITLAQVDNGSGLVHWPRLLLCRYKVIS